MYSKISESQVKLLVFSFFTCLVTYGFAITNFTITIDNEMPILSDFGMDLGRWGQNLIRYRLFNGYMPYFSLLLSLGLFSLAAVRIADIFKFRGVSAYLFCGLFLSFPQLSYQIVFSMMADVAGLGVLLSAIAMELFLNGFKQERLVRKLLAFATAALVLMFTLSIYQAFILIPIVLYVLLLFQNSYDDTFRFKLELKKAGVFAALMIVSIVLYVISVKIICPPIQDSGYLSSFISGDSSGQFSNFLTIWYDNLAGNFYYGEKTIVLAVLAGIFLIVTIVLERRQIFVRLACLFAMALLPFLMSAFITNGYHPPRLYLTSNLVFAFLLVFSLLKLKVTSYKITALGVLVVIGFNVYFVTNLYRSANSIYKHDKKIAERIDNIIQTKYPEFYAGEKTVYFYGYFPYDHHQALRLDKSEVFGGSFYNWDNGNNYRLINFFNQSGAGEYRMVNTQQELDRVKDSVSTIPKWPDYNSVKLVNGIVVVKLSDEKGGKLYFEP